MIIPIVVVAYNRPQSLSRLLKSLVKANYKQKVDIIISIDGGGSEEVLKIGKDFKWNFGNKEIIQHKENIGLRKHVLSCGDISQNYDGIILLEEDLFVSPEFYNYTLEVTDYYKHDNEIAGIALYSHSFNETARLPFYPIEDGYDVFFMQLACSWGQCWTKKQWLKFKKWYNNSENLKIDNHFLLPSDIYLWPETSWKKYFIKYMIENNKYFVYPRISFSTNFGDKGQHHNGGKNLQVPLQYAKKYFNFIKLKKSFSIYDSFCEIFPSCLNRFRPDLNKYDYCVDLYGMKPLSKLNSKFILTSKKANTPLLKFGKELLPLEVNIIEKIQGEGLFFSIKKNCQEINDYFQYRNSLCSDKHELMYHYNLTVEHFSEQEKMKLEIRKKNEELNFKNNRISKLESELNFKNNRISELERIAHGYSYRLGRFLLSPVILIKNLMKKNHIK